MQKFFIEEAYFNDFTLPEDLIYQCEKVLRYHLGDTFMVGVSNKNYLVEITNITLKALTYKVIKEVPLDTELDIFVSIIQGYPKGDKFESIIKHGTELGATSFIPCLLERCQFKTDKERMASKICRFKKIIREASEQSFRNTIPSISNFTKLKDLDLSLFDHVFVCYEEEAKQNNLSGLKQTLKQLNKGAKIAFLIGPEGGITSSEISYLKGFKNTSFVSLGKRILRTETAALYALSVVSYERELI